MPATLAALFFICSATIAAALHSRYVREARGHGALGPHTTGWQLLSTRQEGDDLERSRRLSCAGVVVVCVAFLAVLTSASATPTALGPVFFAVAVALVVVRLGWQWAGQGRGQLAVLALVGILVGVVLTGVAVFLMTARP
jgi:hypothetical protein